MRMSDCSSDWCSSDLRLWLEGEGNSRRDALMKKPAYKHFEEEVGPCGVVPLADASVSVPFVGAATAALALAQLARVGAMVEPAALLPVALGSPSMTIDGGHRSAELRAGKGCGHTG